MQTINLGYTLEFDEYLEYYKTELQSVRQFITRWGAGLVGLVLILFSLQASQTTCGAAPSMEADPAIVLLVLWSILAGVLMITYPLMTTGKRLGNYIYRASYPKGIPRVELTIDEDGIKQHFEDSQQDFKWNAFQSRKELRKSLVLQVGAVVYIYPKKEFSEEQWRAFMELANKYVSEK